jgi:dTDP-glucose pyrophosphorylase
MRTVCLLTAGIGSRMGVYSDVINKTLLPIKEKAIISHIIEQFPIDTKYVIACGYKKDVVKSYISLAHANRNIIFVDVENYAGPGSGPAHSVFCCKEHLMDGFTLVACDGYYENLNDIPTYENIVAVSNIDPSESPSYCNIEVNSDDRITSVVDKKYCQSGLAANGVYHFKDVKKFFEDLKGTEISSGYKNLEMYAKKIPWVDLGTYNKYQKYCKDICGETTYDYSKTDEFLYIINGRVIKFFNDATITKNRVKRAFGRDYFPHIDFHEDQMYSYKFVDGETLYRNNNIEIFKKFVNWLEQDVWPNVSSGLTLTKQQCEDFYYKKTFDRLDKFRKKYPDFNPRMVNGTPINFTMENALNKIDWEYLCQHNLEERTAFIHGDLQFDNLIYDGKDTFKLLDWRQDFAGKTEVGDLYYDIGKMLGGMIINYDLIKRNLFTYEEETDKIFFEFARRSSHDKMIEYLKSKYNDSIIDDIVTLIYLNMSPLHKAPYDKMLFSFALERLNSKYD